ncbi:MAG: hypothetical protein JO050_03990 [Acidimicrobiia bacterium]|nr:hypothetical protein [Acidimicrobiia bacterium]
MERSALLGAQASQAKAEAAIARARSAREHAAAVCEAAQSTCLQAIQARFAAGRLHRNTHGPIYAMADAVPDDFAGHSVEAHRLLGSSSIVCMGIGTLKNLRHELSDQNLEWLLDSLATHASTVDDGLKAIARGMDPDGDGDGDGDGRAHLAQHVIVSELVHGAIELGIEGADSDEATVELLALSAQNRKAIEMAVEWCGYLDTDDNVDRAVGYLNEALSVGDRHAHWLT